MTTNCSQLKMPAADGKMYKNNSRLKKKTIRRNKDYGLEVRLNLLRVNFYRPSYKKSGDKSEKSEINQKIGDKLQVSDF